MIITNEILQKIKDLCYFPKTDTEIAKELGICSTTVYKARHSMNIPTWKELHRKIYFEKIAKLIKQGLNDKQIAKILQKDSRTIQYYRKLAEIPSYKLRRKFNSQYDRTRALMVRNSKSRSKVAGIDFNIDFTDIELPEFCPILNIKLYYNMSGNQNSNNQATIDRIDNSKGYIKGNVIVISRLANAMKNEANFEQLFNFCKNISVLINYYKNQGTLGSFTDVFPNISIKNFSLDS